MCLEMTEHLRSDDKAGISPFSHIPPCGKVIDMSDSVGGIQRARRGGGGSGNCN